VPPGSAQIHIAVQGHKALVVSSRWGYELTSKNLCVSLVHASMDGLENTYEAEAAKDKDAEM
jgi:hypothetical protein